MASLSDRFQTIWTRIQRTPTQIPTRINIPASRIDIGTQMETTFQPNTHYFQVRVNEMYLTDSRQWFSKYDPLVCFVSEFTYDKQVETVPFIVGPSLVEKYGQKVPKGMLFSNTRVAGLHPYRGGKLAFSVILCQVQRANYVRELLRIVESTASVIDFSTALSTYIKVADVILDGFETLFSLDNTQPLIGIRQEFDPGAGDELKPSFFALIDKPESELDVNQLWVRDNQLVYGASLTEAKPFREAGYVLYSLLQTSERQDETTLPFYPLYEKVKEAATIPAQDSWKRARANMFTLYQNLILSPDLTPPQARSLTNKYVTEMKELYAVAVGLGALGAEEFDIGVLDESDIDANLNRGLEILELKL
ncbi:MAG: hypothetical protein AB4426_26360 [Xenococcaceae cyanobacterium]